MIIADLVSRIRNRRESAIVPTIPVVPQVTYPRTVTCHYCLTDRVVARAPKRPNFCSHRCQRKAFTRIIHGMRVRYEMAAKAERAKQAAERKAKGLPAVPDLGEKVDDRWVAA